jgi:HlyD family secretion protein
MPNAAVQASGALSASQINQLLTAETTAAARVQATQAQMAAHEVRIRQTELRAPDGGIISARMVNIGAVPGPGQEMFRLIRQGRLEWRGEVTAAELQRIKPGMAVQLRGAGEQVATGTVRLIGPTVDPQTRNALVYVDVPRGHAAGLLPGMFARGDFEVGRRDALVVPQASIVMRDGFAQLALLPADVADGAVARVNLRKVELGRRQGDWVEVLQGLDPSAQVVVTGAGFLNDGDTVRVVAAAAANATAKSAVSAAQTPQAAPK